MRNPLDREREHWEKQYGAEWVESLEGVRHWADEMGIPVQAGSSELLGSELAASWGWGGLPGCLYEASRGRAGDLLRVHGSWVLRVPPGCGGVVRDRIDRDRGLAPRSGTPWIQIEETSLAYLPAIGSSSARWPSPEAWHRSATMLDPAARPGRVLVPSDFADLVRGLEVTRAPERVALDAWDRWRAAAAWDLDRGAYWLARHAAGYFDIQSGRGWFQRASGWGARVLEPISACLTRLGSKGGNSPFLPHTVIAHNPRPAVLRSGPGALRHVLSGGSR